MPATAGRNSEVEALPQSIAIAAFVFGAILLLIALLGGGFKLFGAEIEEKAQKWTRVSAGCIGVLFILLGIGQGAGNGGGTPAAPQASSAPSAASVRVAEIAATEAPRSQKTVAVRAPEPVSSADEAETLRQTLPGTYSLISDSFQGMTLTQGRLQVQRVGTDAYHAAIQMRLPNGVLQAYAEIHAYEGDYYQTIVSANMPMETGVQHRIEATLHRGVLTVHTGLGETAKWQHL